MKRIAKSKHPEKIHFSKIYLIVYKTIYEVKPTSLLLE